MINLIFSNTNINKNNKIDENFKDAIEPSEEKSLKNMPDNTLESKIKKILENDNTTFDQEEMNIEVYEFPGCIHENITPKDYNKKRNNFFNFLSN